MLVALLSGPGCGPLSSSPRKATHTDGLGRAVKLTLPARRVVAMGPSNTEILFAIGAGSQVVGRDDFSDFPPAATHLRAVGSGPALNLELMVALKPDLVLAAQIYSSEQIQSLENLELPTFLLANPSTFDGLFTNIRLVGDIVGARQSADVLVQTLRLRVEAVTARTRGVTRRPRVFYELDASDPAQPWTAGPGTFIQTLIELAGGSNIGDQESKPFPRLSAETILRLDPEVIVLGDALHGITEQSVKARAGWSNMTAVRQEAVHAFDDNLASRPGPRLVDGLELLARLIHPTLFDPEGKRP